MIEASTKDAIIGSFDQNWLLQQSYLSPTPSSPLDLAAEHPLVPVDPRIAEAAARALEEGQTHYVDVPGIPALRGAVATYLQGLGLASYTPMNVLVTAGMQEARFLALQIIGEDFSHIGLPEVVHPGVRQAIGVRPIETHSIAVERDSGLLASLDSIQAALEQGCRLLFLESPVRLTGASYTQAEVQRLAHLITQYDAALVWDQGMACWADPGAYVSIGSIPGMLERSAVLGEVWPGMGLESWFVGYIGTNDAWLERMRSQKQIMAICTSTPSQYAALAAADLFPQHNREQQAILKSVRLQALELATKLGLMPLRGDTANVLALQKSDNHMAGSHFKRANIAYADGENFGASGIVRLAITADGAITRALTDLASTMDGGTDL